MGFVRKLTGADAAKEAAHIQAEAGRDAIGQLRQELGLARETLQPFVDSSLETIEGLKEMATPEGQAAVLANDPQYQNIQDFERGAVRPELERLDFDPVRDNPFLRQAQDEVERRLTQRNAALGRFDSGDTRVDMARQLALTGNQLANDEFRRRSLQSGFNNQTALGDFDMQVQQDSLRFNDLLSTAAARSGIVLDQFNQQNALLSAGLAAAGGQAQVSTNLGTNLATITQGIGNARAAGEIGASNARRGFYGGLLNLVSNVASGGMGGGGPGVLSTHI